MGKKQQNYTKIKYLKYKGKNKVTKEGRRIRKIYNNYCFKKRWIKFCDELLGNEKFYKNLTTTIKKKQIKKMKNKLEKELEEYIKKYPKEILIADLNN